MSGSDIADGKFHHIVYTYNNGSRKIYIDGSLDASLDTNTGICNIEEIGAQSDGSEKFDGIINEVSVWSVELSLAEIQ